MVPLEEILVSTYIKEEVAILINPVRDLIPLHCEIIKASTDNLSSTYFLSEGHLVLTDFDVLQYTLNSTICVLLHKN